MHLLIFIAAFAATDCAMLEPPDSFEKVDIRMPSVLPSQVITVVYCKEIRNNDDSNINYM